MSVVQFRSARRNNGLLQKCRSRERRHGERGNTASAAANGRQSAGLTGQPAARSLSPCRALILIRRSSVCWPSAHGGHGGLFGHPVMQASRIPCRMRAAYVPLVSACQVPHVLLPTVGEQHAALRHGGMLHASLLGGPASNLEMGPRWPAVVADMDEVGGEEAVHGGSQA